MIRVTLGLWDGQPESWLKPHIEIHQFRNVIPLPVLHEI